MALTVVAWKHPRNLKQPYDHVFHVWSRARDHAIDFATRRDDKVTVRVKPAKSASPIL